jgi:superfamily I DNA/RNA helicase
VSELIQGGIPPGDILILAQRSVIGTPIYEALVGRGIPTKSYYAEAELDDQFAQQQFARLKLYVDPEDRVALRWLLGLHSGTWLCRGYARLRRHAEEQGASPWRVLEDLEQGVVNIPHTNGLVQRFRQIKAEVEALAELDVEHGLRRVVDELFPPDEPRVRDLRALCIQLVDAQPDIGAVVFLRELVAAIAKPEIPSEVNDVRIMSLHKSKGLSAPVTIIAGCVDGLLPKQPDENLPAGEILAQIEEQRRLFYVGISRVKACPDEGKPGTLILTYSRQMALADVMGAGIAPAQVAYGEAHLHASRFIRDMGRAAPAPRAG